MLASTKSWSDKMIIYTSFDWYRAKSWSSTSILPCKLRLSLRLMELLSNVIMAMASRMSELILVNFVCVCIYVYIYICPSTYRKGGEVCTYYIPSTVSGSQVWLYLKGLTFLVCKFKWTSYIPVKGIGLKTCPFPCRLIHLWKGLR